MTGTARIPERGRIEVDVETVAGANVDGRADPGSVRGGVADAAGHATLTVTHGPGAAPTTIHVYARLDGRSGMADVAVPVVRSLRLHSAGRVDRPGVSCSLPERCEIWFDADTGTVHASGLPDGTVVTADGREGSVVGGALSISLDPLTLLDRQPIARTLRDLVSVSIDLTVRLPESASTEEGAILLNHQPLQAMLRRLLLTVEHEPVLPDAPAGSGAAVLAGDVVRVVGDVARVSDIAVVGFVEMHTRALGCGVYGSTSTGERLELMRQLHDLTIVARDRRTGATRGTRSFTAPSVTCPREVTSGGDLESHVPTADIDGWLLGLAD